MWLYLERFCFFLLHFVVFVCVFQLVDGNWSYDFLLLFGPFGCIVDCLLYLVAAAMFFYCMFLRDQI